MQKLKKQKMSKLAKRIADVNGKYWRNKADKAWKELVFIHGGAKCAICDSNDWLQAHHLIPREMTSHRHVVANGILLCASHHKYSFELSPHKAPVAFFGWIIKSNGMRWAWLLEQVPSRSNPATFKDIYLGLEKELISIKNTVKGEQHGMLREQKEISGNQESTDQPQPSPA